MKTIDATGQKFGRLTLIERIPIFKRPTKYRCRCECGTELIVLWSNIQRNTTQSCGCLRKDTIKKTKLKPVEDVLAKQIFSYYRKNAISRDIPWLLSLEEVRTLIFQPCLYCGITGETETILGGTKRKVRNNGIDRRENNLGYTIQNSVPCCKSCNFSKGSKTEKEFSEWIKRIIQHGYLCNF